MGPGSGFWSVVEGHARRYPRWEVVDLYKLLHQATQGSEHAVPEAGSARRRLERELQEMGPGPAEPLVDLMRPDGALARVHLRPWQQAGFAPADLLDAFLSTAEAWRARPGELEQALDEAASRAGDLGLEGRAVTALAERMKAAGFPPAHHSPGYCAHYRPAYRVVATRLLPKGLPARSPGSGE